MTTRRVLLIGTGGTIASEASPDGLVPVSLAFSRLLSSKVVLSLDPYTAMLVMSTPPMTRIILRFLARDLSQIPLVPTLPIDTALHPCYSSRTEQITSSAGFANTLN